METARWGTYAEGLVETRRLSSRPAGAMAHAHGRAVLGVFNGVVAARLQPMAAIVAQKKGRPKAAQHSMRTKMAGRQGLPDVCRCASRSSIACAFTHSSASFCASSLLIP